jgi:phage repressor protein C with HTH and peptisase S24 domain
MHSLISDKAAFVSELLLKLRQRIVTTKESESAFAKRLGSSEALFKNLSSGSLPAADRLAALLLEIGETLILGADPPRETGLITQVTLDGTEYASVALHDAFLSAGPGCSNGGSNVIDHLAFRRDWLSRIGVSPTQACLARVRGDSMFPTLSPNDMVLINTKLTEPPVRARSDKDKRRASIYAFIQDGEARVKRIERPDPDMIMLLSDNPDYSPEILTGARAASVQIIGKVVWWGHTASQ